MDGADGRALLTGIGATARPAGSDAETAARSICADWLRDSGFIVTERPFTYSALPGVWGSPIVGLALVLLAISTAVSIEKGVSVSRCVGLASLVLLVTGVVGWWVGRYGTRLLPVMRRHGVNLEARREGDTSGAAAPAVWLVAHLDSKSQPVSLLTRALASISVVVCWTGLLAAFALSHIVPVPGEVLSTIALSAALFAVPLLISRLGAASDGALDNASGVASILAASRVVGLATPLGIVVTSAEEFGLAGARAWAEGMPRAAGVAINCDGVDDRGRLTVTTSSAGRALLGDIDPSMLSGQNIRIRRSLPGILLDSTAFADRGWAAYTVSQGTFASLMRVHTEQDTLKELSGAGIDRAANFIAALAGAIIASNGSFVYQKGAFDRRNGTATSD